MKIIIAIITAFLIAAVGASFVFSDFDFAMADNLNFIQMEDRTRTSAENSSLPKLNQPKIVIKKRDRKLQLFDGSQLVKTYDISLGFEPLGDKQIEGDGKTPEGEFYIFTKNPNSKFYLSLGISYPSIEDAERGLSEGLISQAEHNAIAETHRLKQAPPQKTRLGGEIYIHGGGAVFDWTEGCIALANTDIKEMFDVIDVGTPVVIEE